STSPKRALGVVEAMKGAALQEAAKNPNPPDVRPALLASLKTHGVIGDSAEATASARPGLSALGAVVLEAMRIGADLGHVLAALEESEAPFGRFGLCIVWAHMAVSRAEDARLAAEAVHRAALHAKLADQADARAESTPFDDTPLGRWDHEQVAEHRRRRDQLPNLERGPNCGLTAAGTCAANGRVCGGVLRCRSPINCDRCRAFDRLRWREHLNRVLRPYLFTGTLYNWVGPTDDANRMAYRIRRLDPKHKEAERERRNAEHRERGEPEEPEPYGPPRPPAEYVSIKAPGGMSFILSNVPFAGSEATSAEAATRRLFHAIDQMPSRVKRGIRASRGWQRRANDKWRGWVFTRTAFGDLASFDEFMGGIAQATPAPSSENAAAGNDGILARGMVWQLPKCLLTDAGLIGLPTLFKNLRDWAALGELPPDGDLATPVPEIDYGASTCAAGSGAGRSGWGVFNDDS